MKIEYQGYTYFVKQRENEMNKETILRSWYIGGGGAKNKINFDSIEKKSMNYVYRNTIHTSENSINYLGKKNIPKTE